MLKKLFLPLLLFLFFLGSAKVVSAQVNCGLYCPNNYPSRPQAQCSTSNPSPTSCTATNYYCTESPLSACYCCSSVPPTPTCTPDNYSCNPQDPAAWCCNSSYVCNGYCAPYSSPIPTNTTTPFPSTTPIPSPINTITPGVSPQPSPPPSSTPGVPTITPTYPICTGFDGPNPCQQYNCTGTPASACEQNGGICLNSYCYPANCRCGESANDCPDFWTCKTDGQSYCREGTPTSCSSGYINCTLGLDSPDCTPGSTNCERECNTSLAVCSLAYGKCYVTATCGYLEDGRPGTCITDDGSCPTNRDKGRLDCVAGNICCAQPPECIGRLSNTPGQCFFLNCPTDSDYFWEGSNPPFSDIGCPLFQSCCTRPGDDWLNRYKLSNRCVTNGEQGIATAIGCVAVTSPTEFLRFVLPWAIGVGAGVAFILMIVAGYLMMTSGGDPYRARAAKELLGAAIAGLLMIVFSVYLLDVIGLRILRLPGL